MITKEELKDYSKIRNLNLGQAEKDYFQNVILFILYQKYGKNLVFKGGTALSKLYFPQRWRFSEDLDFTVNSKIENMIPNLERSLSNTSDLSGIGFRIRSTHKNPDYMQIKIQYDAILAQRNTAKLDLFWDEMVYFSSIESTYSSEDVSEFDIRYYSLEEIFVEKLRSLFQRARARDYFDIYWLIKLNEFNDNRIKEALEEKAGFKGLDITRSEFPSRKEIEEVRNYWNTALDRLTSSKPEFDDVVQTIKAYMEKLWQYE